MGDLVLNTKDLLQKHYGISGAVIKRLGGYENVNFKVTLGDNVYVLKQYTDERGLEERLEAEDEILKKLSELSGYSFPHPQDNVDGDQMTILEKDGEKTIIRLLSYIEGELYSDAENTPDLAKSLGRFLATLDKHLFDHRSLAIEARHLQWDLQYHYLNRPFIKHISDPNDRKVVEYYFLQHEEFVRPNLPGLRKSIIHSDANGDNLIVRDGGVTGIIDFFDMSYSQLINEIAIAIAYAILGKNDPIGLTRHIIGAYNEILPLKETEVDLLYLLIAARLCASVCNSSYFIKQQPENEHIRVNQKQVFAMLHKWISISPGYATAEFRRAAGMTPVAGQSVEDEVEQRNNHISKALSLSFPRPIKMTGAAFQYMYDSEGNTYLDAYNNIPHVGHCHPRVVQASRRQMAALNTNTRYLTDQLNNYAERLLAKFPEALSKVFFVNSGSEASDLAIRLSMNHTGNGKIMVMEGGYHGLTRLGIDISHYKYTGPGGHGKADYVIEVLLPDSYKGAYRSRDANTGKRYASDVIAMLQTEDPKLAAFISEPIVGCGGQVPIAAGYLEDLYPAVRERGGVCISDEVQTGFGRLGAYFWGYEMHGVVPDIVVLGKSMGNGYPLSAVVTTNEISASFEGGMEFFSSFGGNTVSCEIGMAVLGVIEEEELQNNAVDVGNYLKKSIAELMSDCQSIGDVRGEGFFLGVELIKDGDPNKPDTSLANKVQNGLKEAKILVGTDGPDRNVLKIKPPMCFNRQNADQLVAALEQILDTNP